MATTTAQSVQGFYQNILRRTGSAADVTFWSNTVDVQGVPLSQVQNEFVTSPESMTFVLPIVQIYQTYLGRAPDSAGFTAWVKAFEAGTSLSVIQSDFANSAESAKFYGGSITTPADSAFVTQLYQTVLNRGPTPAEVTAVLAVTTNRATLLADFMASPEAQVTLTNASNQFLNTIGGGSTNPYGLPLFNGGGIASNVFTLTPGADTIPGGLVGSNGTSNNGNVIINGAVDTTTPANSTLNPSDNLDGGTGANTINVTYSNNGNASAPNGALISQVQTFNMRNTGTGIITLDASQIAGLTTANSNLGTGSVVVTNLATGASAGIIGNGTVQNGSLEFGYKTATDAATLNLSGGVSQGAGLNVIVDGSPATLQINSTGNTANKINNVVNGTNSVKTVNIKSDANLTTTGFVDTVLATITLSGAATAVDLGTENSAAGTLKNVDATGLTGGGVKVNVGPNTTNAAFTFTGGGGSGNTLILPTGELAILTSGAQLNGGSAAGNTLATADVALNAAAATVVNASTKFQTLEFVGASATLDQSTITNTAFTKAQFGLAGAGAVMVNNATTATQYSIAQTAAGTGAITLNAALGQNTLNLSLDGTSKASVSATSITVASATTLSLASNGSFTTTPNTIGGAVTLPDNSTLKITGPESLTFTGAVQSAAPVAGETVDASAFTGKLTINQTAGNSKTVFTTGSGGSDLTAATITINNFTLGTGADKLSFLGTSSQIGAGTGTTDTATNFDATKDSFVLPYIPTAVDTASGVGTGVLLTDLKTAIGAAGITAGHVDNVTLTGGTDAGTYLAAKVGGGVLVATDQAIHLAGLTGTLGTGNFA